MKAAATAILISRAGAAKLPPTPDVMVAPPTMVSRIARKPAAIGGPVNAPRFDEVEGDPWSKVVLGVTNT
jgi:hypothetical protein